MSIMKKLVISIIVVLIIVLVGIIIWNKKPVHETATATYTGTSGIVQAVFDISADTVTFGGTAFATTTLPHAISASGARYANSDESIVFWEHQGEATITKSGTEIFKGKKI